MTQMNLQTLKSIGNSGYVYNGPTGPGPPIMPI